MCYVLFTTNDLTRYEAAYFMVTSPNVVIKRGSLVASSSAPAVRDQKIAPSKFACRAEPKEKDTTCPYHSYKEYIIEWPSDKDDVINLIKKEFDNDVRPSWEKCLEETRKQNKKQRTD